MIDLRRLQRDLLALVLLAGVVFVGLSLVSYDPADAPGALVYPPRDRVANLCGPLGAQVASGLRMALGLGAWSLLLTMISVDLKLFSREERPDLFVRMFGGLLSITAVCAGLRLLIPHVTNGPVVGSGGYLGAWTTALLEHEFSPPGVLILIAAALAAGVLLSGEMVLLGLALKVLTAPWRAGRAVLDFVFGRRPAEDPFERVLSQQEARTTASDTDETPRRAESAEPEEPEPAIAEDGPPPAPIVRQPIKVNPPVGTGRSREKLLESLEEGSRRLAGDFTLPGASLLDQAEEFPYELLAKKAQIAAVTLEKTFQEFGLNVRVAEIDTGPVITQFELELEAGLRLNKVTALADDLAIALRVPSVRVVAPIPGKNTVGVEVPNEKQVMVRLRELIESCPQDLEKKRIPIFVGKDVSGRPLVVDLTKMPHLLIAGRTGTGKSVCLNALILSILMTRSPDEVKMLMIDPKMVELSPYKRVPHLMHPVITDMKKAEAVLAWAVDKMEERYDLLARCGVRHLDSYNELGKEAVLDRLGLDADSEEAEFIPESMPYIVIIADEMADMMMTSGKDVEGHIIRLAQKSRAVGIHLVLATQKPTVDVITGLIKSNLPARMSFQVASRTDSRVVLDEMGAERLLGNGDMLYLAPGTSNITRAQGAFVSDREMNTVIDFYSEYEPQYSTELAQLSTSRTAEGSSGGDRGEDDMYEQAIEVVIREGIGSVSRLQRFLGIGYGRAARMMDWMAEDGIVGEYNGSKAREVLYTPEQWEALKASRAETVGV